MEGLSSLEGWALIATYFVAMMMLVVFLRKHKKTKEEFLVAEDLGRYYRVPADNRDLNYDKYFVQGDERLSVGQEYNSNNTERLNVEQIKEKLLALDYIQEELKGWRK